jgi:hypothetical protein
MPSINPNYFIHAANVLLLVAYSVRDVLWLRLFAVASALIAIPYFVLQPATLWAPLSWTVVFAGINSFQSWRLFVERRPIKLTPEEQKVRDLAFEQLPPRKVLQVLSLGSWTTAAAGEYLLEQGKCAETISLIVHGKVQVIRQGRRLGELIPGHLVGSFLILAGLPADVDAVAAEQVRMVRWQVETLDRYLSANPETRIVMQRHLVSDLVAKLKGLSQYVA